MDHTYIIGEIGQNHNGSVDIGKQIIDVVAKPVIDHFYNRKLRGVDAIKLTKRDLKEELSADAWNKPYISKHSFGKTYGQHRECLELSNEEHFELFKYAKSKKLDVVETLCAIGCLSMFRYFEPDFIKVASRDLTNLPLLEALAETKIPIIMSTGMSGKEELQQAIDIISKRHGNITILHCLSQYPADYHNINLLTIHFLLTQYPQYTIGYSDHSIGIVVPAVAVGLGAKVIEKHITLDRNMKGTDHAGSLGPDGIYRMVRDIRNIEMSMGENDMFLSESVIESKIKLERSIATRRKMEIGEIIGDEDIHLLSPGDGFKWFEKHKVIGKKLIKSLGKDQIIYNTFIN
jgi:sialic acid synthase